MTEITDGNLVKFATKILFTTVAGNNGVAPTDITLFTNEVEIVGITIGNSKDLDAAYNTAVTFRDQDDNILASYGAGTDDTLVVSNPAFWNFTSLKVRTVESGGGSFPVNSAWLTIYYRETG